MNVTISVNGRSKSIPAWFFVVDAVIWIAIGAVATVIAMS